MMFALSVNCTVIEWKSDVFKISIFGNILSWWFWYFVLSIHHYAYSSRVLNCIIKCHMQCAVYCHFVVLELYSKLKKYFLHHSYKWFFHRYINVGYSSEGCTFGGGKFLIEFLWEWMENNWYYSYHQYTVRVKEAGCLTFSHLWNLCCRLSLQTHILIHSSSSCIIFSTVKSLYFVIVIMNYWQGRTEKNLRCLLSFKCFSPYCDDE